MFQGRQSPERLAEFLLRDSYFEQTLQVQPEFGSGTKEMSETQSRVPGDGAPSVQDLGDAVGRDLELPRQLRRTHFKFAELFSEVFAGMNCNDRHFTPNDSQQFRRWKALRHRRTTRNICATGH